MLAVLLPYSDRGCWPFGALQAALMAPFILLYPFFKRVTYMDPAQYLSHQYVLLAISCLLSSLLLWTPAVVLWKRFSNRRKHRKTIQP
jgi:hypothetical protein